MQFPIRGSSAAQNCVWCATSLAVPVDTAWYLTEAPDRERILIAAVVGVGIGKSKRPFCSCVISTESRRPRRMVSEVGEMSPAQDPDSIAAWPGAANVYGVPQVVTLAEVCVLLPQPAIAPSASGPTSNRSARTTSQHYGQPPAISRPTGNRGAPPFEAGTRWRGCSRCWEVPGVSPQAPPVLDHCGLDRRRVAPRSIDREILVRAAVQRPGDDRRVREQIVAVDTEVETTRARHPGLPRRDISGARLPNAGRSRCSLPR